MAKEKKRCSVLGQARSWATKHGLFGPQAFLRYIILTYLESLNDVSRDFVFKGGNLLWTYIRTPRSTVDLDLATLTLGTHEEVRRVLEKACRISKEITFSISEFKKIDKNSVSGASVTILYKTAEGATNSFEIDIVYELPTDIEIITSPLTESREIQAASIENIITDKLSALYRFGAGNTRIKDLDDLWRLSQTKNRKINSKKLKKLVKGREISLQLNKKWISDEMEQSWKNHKKRYPDLPDGLFIVFSVINKWLGDIAKQ